MLVNMIFSSLMVIFSMLMLFIGSANLTVVLNTNGYSNIVVAISEDVPQSVGGGNELINDLKALLTETSAVLFNATNNRVYLKEISILIPSTWTSGTASVTSKLSYELADIRLTNEPVNSASGSLPYTTHSGKCGVAGNFITLPTKYLADLTANLPVQAKGLVQQWAQFRYGVFEEHGYPNDELLPYFYRHPDGYDAVTSSNNTEIKGNLEKLSGGNCEVNANGIISDQGNCRFIPSAAEQTATTSLMSFHWLDTVVGFSGKDNHDRRPPHRQNRLCNSRSSAEVMANLPDFSNVTPNPGQSTIPTFQLLQNLMLPVVYIAMDTSMPSNPNNLNPQVQNILKRGLTNLFFLLTSYPEILVAWSTFENIDFGSEGSYLKEELPPRRIEDGKDDLDEKVNNFLVSQNVLSRDVSAAVRDAESRLRQYKDIGGSILYIITSTDSVTNDTVIETDMAEILMRNNIKLIVAETGTNTSNSLSRFSVLSQGGYYFKSTWDSTFFTPINNEIDNICKGGFKTERRIITSQKGSISASIPWKGSFSIDETLGRNTTLALSLPKEGSFTVTLTSPSGDVMTMPNEPEVTNWNYRDSTVRVIWQKIANTAAIGRWGYQVTYDATSCSLCETQPEIHLQIGSSFRSATSTTLPKFQPWISLTAGSAFIDLSEHPAIIQARFEYAGSYLGGLTVTADLVLDSMVESSISLFDTGLIDPDISKDGIYSGIFYPTTNGNYKVNLYAVHSTTVTKGSRILSPDQNNYCCGSSLPTTTLNYFQITAREAITFEVRNAGNPGTFPQESLPTVSDIQSYTYGVDQGLVYTELTWTVPSNTKSQVVKYSEDYEQLLDNTDGALVATVVYGSIDAVEAGTAIAVYVSAPYTKGKSVYFLVETTTTNDKKSRSHIVWTESNPPEEPFTTPGPTTEATSTSTQQSTSTSTSTPETTSTSSSIETSTSNTDFSSDSSTAVTSTVTDDGSSTVTSSLPISTDSSTSTDATTGSTASTSTDSTGPTSTDATSISTSTSLDSTTTITTTTDSRTTTFTTGSSSGTPTTATATTTSVSSTSTSSLPTSTNSETSTETIHSTDSTFSSTDDSTTIDSTTESISSTTDTTGTSDSTTSAPTTKDPGDGGDGDGLTSAEIGYIVGGVVGAVVVIGAITGGVVFYKKKHNVTTMNTTNNGRGNASGTSPGRSEYSNTPYPPSTSYPAPAKSERQVQSFEQDAQDYDNIGVTIEDEDISMTAM